MKNILVTISLAFLSNVANANFCLLKFENEIHDHFTKELETLAPGASKITYWTTSYGIHDTESVITHYKIFDHTLKEMLVVTVHGRAECTESGVKYDRLHGFGTAISQLPELK